jgi:hypothetical protein
MPDEISADRVTAIATAARVPLAPIDAERIARAVAPTAARFAAAKIDLSLETEPASFVAQQSAMPVIGFLGGTSPEVYADRIRAFRQGLKEEGYVVIRGREPILGASTHRPSRYRR